MIYDYSKDFYKLDIVFVIGGTSSKPYFKIEKKIFDKKEVDSCQLDLIREWLCMNDFKPSESVSNMWIRKTDGAVTYYESKRTN